MCIVSVPVRSVSKIGMTAAWLLAPSCEAFRVPCPHPLAAVFPIPIRQMPAASGTSLGRLEQLMAGTGPEGAAAA